MRSLGRLKFVFSLLLFGVLLPARPTQAQTVDPNLWSVDPAGRVTAIARSGNTLYIGGAFSSVGPTMGGGVPVDPKGGAPVGSFAKVAGQVATVIDDEAGGWFIGGTFTGVGGLKRSNLAHVLADGTVSDWDPSPDGGIAALALKGHTLYVGGDFRRIGGKPRRSLAAFDITTGEVAPWDPEPGDGGPGSSEYGTVFTILARGRTVYVGGSFASVGGQLRQNLAALDAKSGRATEWNPDADSWVRALAIHGETLFAGGYFFHLGGQLRKYLGAVDITSGIATPWDPRVARAPEGYVYDGGPRVLALDVRGNTLFAAGAFSTIGGQQRRGLAALSIETAIATSWNPQADGWGPEHPELPFFNALVVHDGAVYAGGEFRSLGGQEGGSGGVGYTGAVDVETGLARPWNPRPNGGVTALAASGAVLYVGGWFSCLRDWVPRAGLAALDLPTGAVTSWDPGSDGVVRNLAVSGKTVYVAGEFSTAGGQPRANLAALDAFSGTATEWRPDPNGWVYALSLRGGTIYAGGWFSNIGGQARNYLAAVDSTSGAATAWNPSPNDIVQTLAVHGPTLYVGGWFSYIGGQPRSYMAALDAANGTVSAWTADADGPVNALAVGQRAIYAGGDFNHVDGQARDGIAALDLISGTPGPWMANASRQILALAVHDNTVYAGGGFSSIGGQMRSSIAALDGTTGSVLNWDPGCDGVVWCLAAGENTVYAGGGFGRMGVTPSAGLAAISAADPPPTAVLGVDRSQPPVLAQNFPNPARSSTSIRFTLPEAAAVNLEVFDLQGRRVAAPLEREPEAAGVHEVQVRTESWPAGCYLYRIHAGTMVVNRKMLVVR